MSLSKFRFSGSLNRCGWGLLFWGLCLLSARADIIWSDLGSTLAHATGAGADILHGAVHREDAGSTLYFKFHVNPISDAGTEPYFAAFELFYGDTERLAVGNALNAWAYGAFNVVQADKTNFNVFEVGRTNNPVADYGVDLHSAKPIAGESYELPRKGIERTIVFKVQYVAGGEDLITVWLDPDLRPGATESNQSPQLTTRFAANAGFNQIRLRHGGEGEGWIFSEMAIATAFSDFVVEDTGLRSGETGLALGRGLVPFTFRKWQREEGLPQNFVRALAQTRDGYLWIGSDAGVSRFDGVRFVPFGLPEGFQAEPVQTLLGDEQGALWIGSAGHGLGEWQNNVFTSFTTRNGLPSDTVNALTQGNDGWIWIGTDKGLAVWQNGQLEKYGGKLADKTITCLCSDTNGIIWIGARGTGIFRLEGRELVQLHDSTYEMLFQDPHCLKVDHEGRLWIGAGEASVLCRAEGEWRGYRFPRHLEHHYICALGEDLEGKMWAGSVSDGLFQFQHGKLVAVNAGAGLSDSSVESLLVDREGKLWVGTRSGLNRLHPKTFSVLGCDDGLGNGEVQGLAEVAPGIVWASKPNEGLFRWDGNYFRPLNVGGFPQYNDHALALLAGRDGNCWIGGEHGVLQVRDVTKAENETGLPALTNLTITALAEDSQSNVWAGTREGTLWVRSNNEWHPETSGPSTHSISAMVSQTNGSIWVGTAEEGLFKAPMTGKDRWQKQKGLLSESIRTLFLDSRNILWIGTGGGGLGRLQNGQITTFTTREGLTDNTISQIQEDDRGFLWLGGDRGIARVNKQELEEVAAQRASAVFPEVFGRAEGMLSEECISGTFPLGLHTRAGQLWFPTQQGIVVMDPDGHSPNGPAPTVVMEETMVDGVHRPGDALNLSPGKHWLEFRYTSVSFDAPEAVRFRYRLIGLDSDWRETGPSRTASFPYVPYGEYRFEVVARNGDGAWSQQAASINVTVKPYLWQTWWFRVPVALALLAMIAITARVLAQRKLSRRLEQLEGERALAQERGRIARDLHDDLGSSLARISLLGGLLRWEKNHPEQIENHAIKISQSADQTMRALEEIVWAVRPGSDSVQSLLEYIAHFANELFEGSGISCRLDLPETTPRQPLPPDVRHNAFLVVKEALTNALKHADAHEVFLSIVAKSDSLEITVRDDGNGFDVNRPARGNGLGNMQRRLHGMDEEITITSQPGKGTTVKFTLHFTRTPANGHASKT